MTTASELAAKITQGDADLNRLHSAINDAPGTWTTDEGTVVDNLQKRLQDVGGVTTRWFATRNDFVTWAGANTPSTGEVVNVGVAEPAQSIAFKYEGAGSVFAESALDGWRAVAPVYLEHYGVETTTKGQGGAPDYTTRVQQAMNATEGELIFTGWVKITDKITCPNDCSPHVPSGRDKGGFTITSSFNMSATCVFQPGTGETAATVGDFGMWFSQPSNPANRAAMTQYPPAIDISSLPRGYIKSLRIENAWDGIKGVGNCGGYRFGVLELGCFNQNIHLDGALDFVHAESIHVWQFGMNANQAAVMYDGSTEALHLGRVDNWSCDKLSVFRSKVILNSDDPESQSRLPFQFGSIAIDGDDALLVLQNGSSQISRLYSTKNAGAPGTERDIHCSAGTHTIGLLQMTSSADGAVLCSGGHLKINSGEVKHLNNGRNAFISQSTGYLDVNNVAMRWDNASDRTQPFMEQQAGSTLRVSNCYAPDAYTNPQNVVTFASDEVGNLFDCPDIHPHTVSVSASWSEGHYNTGNSVTLISTHGQVAEERFRKFSSTEEGFELRFEKAGGTPDAPTAPSVNANVGDLTWAVWDGNSFNNGAYLRGILDATPVDGSTPMKLQFLIEDAAGNVAIPFEATGDKVSINGLTDLNGQLDVLGDSQLRANINHHGDALNGYTVGTWYMRHRVADENLYIGATNAADGLFYPFKIDASQKRTILGEDETTPVLVKGPLDVTGVVKLGPVDTEGGELVLQDKDGNNDFVIDVTSTNNLRIRQGSNVVFNISATGDLSMPGVPEYASDSAAATGGVPLGSFYVKTTTGALTKRRT